MPATFGSLEEAEELYWNELEWENLTSEEMKGGSELVELLGLDGFPRRIEGYDVSHMQGTDVVASMVVFTNGVSDKGEYRKFKTKKDHNNDFYNMHETIKRRFAEANAKKWAKPNLVIIDGGKGQLSAAHEALEALGLGDRPLISLAKRDEEVFILGRAEPQRM